MNFISADHLLSIWQVWSSYIGKIIEKMTKQELFKKMIWLIGVLCNFHCTAASSPIHVFPGVLTPVLGMTVFLSNWLLCHTNFYPICGKRLTLLPLTFVKHRKVCWLSWDLNSQPLDWKFSWLLTALPGLSIEKGDNPQNYTPYTRLILLVLFISPDHKVSVLQVWTGSDKWKII